MTTIEQPVSTLRTDLPTEAGWYEDPHGIHYLRYFTGQEWTQHVTHYGPTPCRGCGASAK